MLYTTNGSQHLIKPLNQKTIYFFNTYPHTHTDTPNTPTVLQSFSPDQPRVDVYLGSDKLTSISLGHNQKGGRVHLALYGGWLGSLAVPQGMTYREAEEEIHRRFPVSC